MPCDQSQQEISDAVKKLVLDSEPPGRMAVLYLIGKAKSLLKNMWLWRPIAALPQPILPKRKWRRVPPLPCSVSCPKKSQGISWFIPST